MKNTERWPSYAKPDSAWEWDAFDIIIMVILPALIVTSMILLCVWAGVSFGARDDTDNNANSQDVKIEFAIAQIKDGINPEIIYDKDTKIMYVVSDNGSLTLLLDSDGSPRKYDVSEDDTE